MKVGDMFPNQYLAADNLDGDTTLTIRGARMEDVKNRDGSTESKPVLHFTDERRTLVLNKTNAKAIVKALGTDESSKWKGRQVTLFVAEVEFKGDLVPGIRIRTTPPADAVDDAPANDFDDEDDIPF